MNVRSITERLGANGAAAQAAQGKEGREEDHHKQALFSLRLEYTTRESKGVLYGSLLGAPYYDPSHGVQMVFEGAHVHGWGNWEYGVWLVSITGCNLEQAYQFISESRERFIRVTEEVSFTVGTYQLKGYSKEEK